MLRRYQVMGLAVVAPFLGCGGTRSHLAETTAIATRPSRPCPVIPDPTPHDSAVAPVNTDSSPRIVIRDGPSRSTYVSILIDGQWAVWNDDQGGARLLGPDIDPNDVERVEVFKGTAGQPYGVCPGVGLIVITTKSKTWRPKPHQGP